ncbi:MAG: rhodanese-like domain-containing protein [Deltaproteobacteria bacterium]|nr:rhodanese-like domain-containing protein [Deltaproteobacteria bacterium]
MRVVATVVVVAGAAAAVAFAFDAARFFGVKEISAADLESLLRDWKGVVIVDVREPAEFARGRIPGAVLMPLGGLPGSAAALSADADVVTYCQKGHRSKVAAKRLMSRGFGKVRNLAGGIEAWRGPVDRGAP